MTEVQVKGNLDKALKRREEKKQNTINSRKRNKKNRSRND